MPKSQTKILQSFVGYVLQIFGIQGSWEKAVQGSTLMTGKESQGHCQRRALSGRPHVGGTKAGRIPGRARHRRAPTFIIIAVGS